MCRLVEIVGHLNRQAAARGEPRGERREQFRVPGHPLQYGIREDQIRGVGILAGIACPRVNVRDLESKGREPQTGRVDHILGGVDTGDSGLREARRDELGRIAGTAADVDRETYGARGDCGQEIAGRPGTLLFERYILLRRPAQELAPPAPAMDIPRFSGPNATIKMITNATHPTTMAIASP